MVHLLIGIPGSGKTTYSKILQEELHCDVISSDKVRDNHPEMTEDKIWPEIYRLVSVDLKNNRDVIFDATNITPKVRRRFKDNVEALGVEVKWGAYYIMADEQECIERVKIRNTKEGERFLPIEVISSYFKSIIPPTMDEGFEFIKYIKDGIIQQIIK